ncbi:hypothetical protein ETAA8_52900 [Anatilimnocola aggregata]|uniref:Knr4/Smi1-like domain-containing protein n=2 Tax=Anatilimnocola aggregata TaxID=2528021 RepID=A0A517YIZ2_9BACT|nr:hypothetical protein ETAA8_52900 [Anatilimnocola aggregata]
MYVWPGFDPANPKPAKFFKNLGIKFDGVLFISYPVKMTFLPLAKDELIQQERLLGAELPADYKDLLQQFGPVHLPGVANIIIESPQDALQTTHSKWCYDGTPLVLAISAYNLTSDGNSIGYLRNGESFGPEIYEFDHERFYNGGDPSAWTRKIGDSLADFLLEYLEGQT